VIWRPSKVAHIDAALRGDLVGAGKRVMLKTLIRTSI
jgi:hypothetical protein